MTTNTRQNVFILTNVMSDRTSQLHMQVFDSLLSFKIFFETHLLDNWTPPQFVQFTGFLSVLIKLALDWKQLMCSNRLLLTILSKTMVSLWSTFGHSLIFRSGIFLSTFSTFAEVPLLNFFSCKYLTGCKCKIL